MTQIIPKSLLLFWSKWEIRLAVLLSLILQSILVVMGSRRKYSANICLRFVLWMAYLSADWIATLAIGAISNLSGGADDSTDKDYILTTFWAPFLLFHLGGPDTITAYSLEDNELWLRNFVMLGGQMGVAFYIFLNAWSDKELNFLSIPMIVAGIIKFGERIWVLRRASSEHFRESFFPTPDPGPNYARLMKEYSSKMAREFEAVMNFVPEHPNVGHHRRAVPEYNAIPDAANLQEAHHFFRIFNRLFAGLTLSIHHIRDSQLFFQSRAYDEVFKLIEIELGFMYDLFYTKKVVLYSLLGGIRRFVTFLCIFSVLVAFLRTEKRAYSGTDVVITYILIAGAIILEIYAVCLLLYSDWTMLWLTGQKNRVLNLLYKAVSPVLPSRNKRWSNNIGQYNLINFCLKDKPGKCSFVRKVHNVFDQSIQKHFYRNFVSTPNELKELIFTQILHKSMTASDFRTCKELSTERGRWVLVNEGFLDRLGWSIDDALFEESILLWHIATDLCFNHDLDEEANSVGQMGFKEMSKLLSEYMLYILVIRSFMLPDGIGQIWVQFQDTRAEANRFFKDVELRKDVKKAACDALLNVRTDHPPSQVKGNRSKSMLFDACILAKNLLYLDNEQNWNKEKMWKLISQVWVEILCHAAGQCQPYQHAQQLRRGGELLTHVWMLMAHLGITENFRISKGRQVGHLIQDLPAHLRECLYCFGEFPENYKIPARRIIALWVAEGLVQIDEDDARTHEEVAYMYLSELIEKACVQVVERKPNGKVKTCCLRIALPRFWFQKFRQEGIISSQRLVYPLHKNDISFGLLQGHNSAITENIESYKDLNSFSFISFDTREGKKPGEDIGNFLRGGIGFGYFQQLLVLDLEGLFRPKLPDTIGKLQTLKYLGLRWTYLESIPSSIGDLVHLETLDLKHTYVHILPSSIWKLQRLRNLYLNQTLRMKFNGQPTGSSFQNLETLWGIILDKDSPLKIGMAKLINLRKLGLTFQLDVAEQEELAYRISKMKKLQSLGVRSMDELGQPKELFLKLSTLENLSSLYLFGRLKKLSFAELPENLTELTLSATCLPDEAIQMLEKPPRLEILHFYSDSYAGKHMVFSHEGFPQLRVLKIWKLKELEEWTIHEAAMPSLRELEIRSCKKLRVPDGLKNLKTLHDLKLTDMPEEFLSRFRHEKGCILDDNCSFSIH